MDLIELIANNVFLKQLFPKGLTEPVFVGQIQLDDTGGMYLGIHTKQKPAIEVSKWGFWNKNYEVIVIKLFARCQNLTLNNWIDNEYGELHIQEISKSESSAKAFLLSHFSEKSSIELECGILIFQGCSTYALGVE